MIEKTLIKMVVRADYKGVLLKSDTLDHDQLYHCDSSSCM